MTEGTARRPDSLLRDVVAVHALLEYEDVAQQLADLFGLRFPSQSTVLLWRDDEGSLKLVARAHADAACESRAREISRELLQQERLDFLRADRAEGAPCTLCVPMRCRGKKVGTVYLEDPRRQSDFDDGDIHSLDILARHAGVALANARVHERLQGEVRELRAAVRTSRVIPERGSEALVARHPEATAPPSHAPAAARLETAVLPLSDIERDAILHALREHRGNRTAAASALGISVRKLQYKIKEYQQEGFDVPRS